MHLPTTYKIIVVYNCIYIKTLTFQKYPIRCAYSILFYDILYYIILYYIIYYILY